MSCDNQELIVGSLYDDLTESEKREFDAHLALCAACREEVAGLRATRGHLSQWAPPVPEFAFRIVREQLPPKVVPIRRRWVPAFALGAAAALVIAVASAIANVEVRYDGTGFVVRTGWGRGDALTAPNGQRSSDGIQPAAAAADFQTLDRRLRELELAVSTQPATGGVQTASARMTDTELLRRIREMVGESETRQQTALTQRLLQVVRDFDRQRESDLAAIQRGLGNYQGLTNAELATQRNVIDHLYRAALRQEK
jgi:hypothetical protein